MLKADLHLHAGEDVFHKLGYTSKELIDYMAKLGFKVIALTFHKNVHYNKELADYASKKGILLISGVERFIDGVEVLIYNLTNEEAQQINSFEDLRAFKKKKGKLKEKKYWIMGEVMVCWFIRYSKKVRLATESTLRK